MRDADGLRRLAELVDALARCDAAQPRGRARGRRAHRHRPGRRGGRAASATESRGCHHRADHPDGPREAVSTTVRLSAGTASRRRPRPWRADGTLRRRAGRGQVAIARALDEDLRYGPDVTTLATVPADATTTASMVTREPGVIAGVDIALLVLDEVLGRRRLPGDRNASTTAPGWTPGGLAADGRGATRGLLTAERTMLNLVCHLSRNRHRDGGLGGRGRGHRRQDPRHPQDPARPARRCRSTRCGSAAASTTGWAWVTRR